MREYGVSLRVFLLGADGHAHVEPALAEVLLDIVSAAKTISREVNKAGLVDILGFTDSTNVHGEQVKKLDIYANEIMIFALRLAGRVCGMASEETEEIIDPSDAGVNSEYIALFDPLDGSSNTDVNLSMGTIFSIYKRKTPVGKAATVEDFLRDGTEQVAAGYFMYGSSTMLVFTAGKGVHGFTLDQSLGEFHISHSDIKIPKRGKIYSANEGNTRAFDEPSRAYIEALKDPEAGPGRPYSLRYVGALVSDFHRNLLKGGIFLYPAVKKSPDEPARGKLRLMYEANPLAFVVEQAGGLATDGLRRIVDIPATDIHQKVPLIIGSEEDVLEYERFCRGEAT